MTNQKPALRKRPSEDAYDLIETFIERYAIDNDEQMRQHLDEIRSAAISEGYGDGMAYADASRPE